MKRKNKPLHRQKWHPINPTNAFHKKPAGFLSQSLFFTNLFMCVFGLAGCSTSNNSPSDGQTKKSEINQSELKEITRSAPTEGNVSLRIVDAPADVKEVWVVVSAVSFKQCESDEWDEKPVGNIPVDLIAVAEGTGNFAEVLSAAKLETGYYCRLRLVLADSGHHVVMKDDSVVELKTPSGNTSGLKGLDAEFYVAPGIETILTIDFDAEKSLVETGNGKYILKPVLDLKSVSYQSQDGEPIVDGELLGSEAFNVDEQGGKIILEDGAELIIPEGALLSPVEITINRWHTDTIGTVSDIYQFLPHIQFEKPVTFTFPYHPELATNDELFVFDDNTIAPSIININEKTVTAELQHFSYKYMRSSPDGHILEAEDKDDYALPNSVCNFPSVYGPKEFCEGGAVDKKGDLAVAIECPNSLRPFMPSCTEITYRDLNDAEDPDNDLSAIRVEFTLTEEEIVRVKRADATIEWQLKFYREDEYFEFPFAAIVNGLDAIETNISGTVMDSVCGDFSPADIARTFAAVTFCPGDLVAGKQYYIEYYFYRHPYYNIGLNSQKPYSYAFEIVPGRVCETFDSSIYKGTELFGIDNIWDACSISDHIPDITLNRREKGDPLALADSNFSWNCVDSVAQVVNECLDNSQGESIYNTVPKNYKEEKTLVVLANNEEYYNRFDKKDENAKCAENDPRIVSSHNTCTPTITDVQCDPKERGKSTDCTIKGGPFVHRQNATFSSGVTERETLPIFVGNLHLGDPIAWKNESEIAFPGTWDCNADSNQDVEVAYRHAGHKYPGKTPYSSKASELFDFDFVGACQTPPNDPNFCQGKVNGWWCAPDDTARLHCLNGVSDKEEPCPMECVSMADGYDDVCLTNFCKDKTDMIHCQGVENKLVHCEDGLVYAHGAECPQGTTCHQLQGADECL